MNRNDLLKKLINMEESIEFLNEELAKYGWDNDKNLVIFKKTHLLNVLNQYLYDAINENDIEKWANAVECREDIGFQKNYEKILKEIIYQLANPEVTEWLTKEKAKILIDKIL